MNLLKDKRVLLTGGSGFLGKVVTRKLYEAGATILVPSHRQLDLMYPINLDAYKRDTPDIIIHLAAKVAGITHNRLSPYDYLQANTAMANNIVEMAYRLSIPIVAAGSVCVYSDKAPLPFQERDIFYGEPEATNLGYGLAKRNLLRLLMLAEQQDPRFRYVFVNSANLYGPGDHFGVSAHVIPSLIHKVAISPRNGNRVRILGTGTTTRDFLYIEDAANAYVMAAERLIEEDHSLICNIGSGIEHRVLDVLYMICEIFDLKPDISVDAEGIDGQKRRWIDSAVARRELGWRSYTELRKGLEETIAWYKTHHDIREVATS